MTYKTDDINLVNKIIEWCKDKYSREECDSEVLKLYELACKANLYLSRTGLDEQMYYEKYGSQIYELAQELGIYTAYDRTVDTMKKRASNSNWDNTRSGENSMTQQDNSNTTIKVPYSVFIELNKKLEPIIKENARDRAEAIEAIRGKKREGRDDD